MPTSVRARPPSLASPNVPPCRGVHWGMEAYLVVDGRRIPIETDSLTIGRNPGSDVSLQADRLVSSLHAVVHRYRGGWSVQDLASLNGTFVNGKRVVGECQLRPKDELQVGRSRFVFRADTPTVTGTSTDDGREPPEVTAAEQRVLVELCSPLVSGDPFPQPASVGDIAKALVIGEETVKWHLKNLTRKFDIHDTPGSRRIALANEVIRQGVVSPGDLLGRRHELDGVQATPPVGPARGGNAPRG